MLGSFPKIEEMDELIVHTCSFRGECMCCACVTRLLGPCFILLKCCFKRAFKNIAQGMPWSRISENRNPYSLTCSSVKQQPRGKTVSNYVSCKFLVFVKVQVNF